MPDAQPAATVAGQSIALNVTAYPDIPNRWGTGHIRATGLRLDYGNSRTPDGRHAFVTGVWVREDGEVTGDPIDRYYDAPDGDTSNWPDWIADLAKENTPVDRAAVLRELVAKAEEWDGHITVQELRRMAAEAPQEPAPAPLSPCTCRQSVHIAEHTGRTIPGCPWCTPAPDIRPNQPAGRTVNTVDSRLLGTKEA